jgi:hypothetical protein
MAGGGGQISSLHLAMAAGGGVLLYAALRGVSPVQALKDVTGGHPPAVSTDGKTVAGDDYQPGGIGTKPWKGSYRITKTPKALQKPSALIAAAHHHGSETYSQEDRWARGKSDCASFVGKSLMDIGITPPGGSTTGDYLSSGSWVKVTEPRAGDVAVSAHHMALFTSGANGIGMQNPRRNVSSDSMDNLMANSGAWQIRRWKGWA